MISAIVLAAGQSRRMGRPKMILPWGESTVIGHVLAILKQSGLEDIIVVTGGARHAVEAAILDYPVRIVYNPDYVEGEMLSTFQAGLGAIGPASDAALVVLGDQPQIQVGVVQSVMEAYHSARNPLIVPSYQMRRGHPWLLDRSLWPEAFALRIPQNLRDFLNRHAGMIYYIEVDTASILQDLDTPADYQKYQPES